MSWSLYGGYKKGTGSPVPFLYREEWLIAVFLRKPESCSDRMPRRCNRLCRG